MNLELKIMMYVIWVIVGIIAMTKMKAELDNELTVGDLVACVVLGCGFGFFAVIIWFMMSDIGKKVIWRKK